MLGTRPGMTKERFAGFTNKLTTAVRPPFSVQCPPVSSDISLPERR